MSPTTPAFRDTPRREHPTTYRDTHRLHGLGLPGNGIPGVFRSVTWQEPDQISVNCGEKAVRETFHCVGVLMSISGGVTKRFTAEWRMDSNSTKWG